MTEPGKIAVGRAEFRPALDGERSEMRVGRQIPGRSGVGQQAAEETPVFVARVEYHDRLLHQPSINCCQRLIRRQRIRKNLRMGGDSEKTQEHHPRQRHGFVGRERAFEPGLGTLMLNGIPVDCVQQQVQIDELQRPLLASLEFASGFFVFERIGQPERFVEIDP